MGKETTADAVLLSFFRDNLRSQVDEVMQNKAAAQATLKAKLDKLQQKMVAATESLLHEQSQRHQRDSADLRAQLKTLTAENAALREEAEYMQAEVEELSQQLEDASEKHNAREHAGVTTTKELKRQLKDLEADNAALYDRNKALNDKLRDVNNHATKLQKAKEDLEAAYADASAVLESCHTNKSRSVHDIQVTVIKPLQEKVEQLQDALDECHELSASLTVTSRALAGSDSGQPFQRPKPPHVQQRRRPSRAAAA